MSSRRRVGLSRLWPSAPPDSSEPRREGYTTSTHPGVASTVTLVRDGDAVIVVDPGMVPSQDSILGPLAEHDLAPHEVTDVVLSHHHPDHTLNAGLFPWARFHDHWAVYTADRWDDSPAEGRRISPGVSLIATRGHTSEDITTMVETDEGLVILTHLWWFADGPPEDPLAEDTAALHESRSRVLTLGPALIVPGHGAPFRPSRETPT